jgi:hypothetical protein
MSLFWKKWLSESDIDEKRKNVTWYFSVFKHWEMPEADPKDLEVIWNELYKNKWLIWTIISLFKKR